MINLVIQIQGEESDHEDEKKPVRNVVLTMRKDLFGSTKLTFEDFRYITIRKESKN